MANPKIFCNVPWTNLHIYWDGRYGACCAESRPPYLDDQADLYNLKSQSVVQWFNSDAMQDMRKRMLSDTRLPECTRCYQEEAHGHESRRIKENFKSAIFTKQAFEESYNQSNWYDRFESALTGTHQLPPNDWHVDLGNECNLACKMCIPAASSKVAFAYRKWGLPVDTNRNWVNDAESWEMFKLSLDQTPINRLHFMGGEPTISKRFYQIIDKLIADNRTDMSLSFVTNGTSIDQDLICKLKLFRSADIEVSIEAFNKTNDYIRQGSAWQDTVATINHLLLQQTDTFHVVLRSVPQLLSINTYHEYIKFAWDQQVSIQSIPLTFPAYFQISVLPIAIREQLIPKYEETKRYIQSQATHEFKSMFTGRDPTRLHMSLVAECESMIELLLSPEPDNVLQLRRELVQWLCRWDREYRMNALEYYPEYSTFLRDNGYETV